MLPDIPAPQTGVLTSTRGIPHHVPSRALQNPTQSSAQAAQRAPSTSLDYAHLGPCGITSKWDLLSQTCSTGAFPALWELTTLSTNEGQGVQSQCSGSQGLCRARLLMSRRVKCQVISDAPEVQNQLIHKLCDLPRVRLLGPCQRISESSLHVGPGRAEEGGINCPPASD